MEDHPSKPDPTISPVRLSDILFEMEGQPDEWSAFVNVKTGQVLSLPHDAFLGVEAVAAGEEFFGDADEAMIALAEEIENSDDFKALPDKFEIHEWSIMRDFCVTVEDEEEKRQLLDSIHGSGAFRAFKSTLHRLGIKDAWFAYRDECMEQIAIDWLEANNVSWTRSDQDDQQSG